MADRREITPELLARLTVVLFSNILDKDVLSGKLGFDSLSSKDIVRLMLQDEYFLKSQSRDSCEDLAYSVIDYVAQKTSWQNGRAETEQNKLNVFDLLLLTLQDLLIMNNNRMECRYQEILSWRMIVRYLGEEIVLATRYAKWDYEHYRAIRDRYDDFAWSYVTKHNNKQLNTIVHRGVSEHHARLWASTPYSAVSWVNLMNYPTDSEYHENLRRLNTPPWSADRERRRGDASEQEEVYVFELAQTRAAWIRLYLCERIAGATDANKRYFDIENVRYREKWRKLLISRNRLQSELNVYAHTLDGSADYALTIAGLKNSSFVSDYRVLIGERWLYYQIFRDYCHPPQQRKLSIEEYNLFFAYLLIRLQIRNMLVQNNDVIGFDNFQQVERRKAYFLNDPESERTLIRLAINDTLAKKYINDLEVRVSPDTHQIRKLESIVNSKRQNDSVGDFLGKRSPASQLISPSDQTDLRQRFYYVFHFLKKRDLRLEPDATYERSLQTGRICRHAELRRIFMEQAKEIVRFREDFPQLAQRVLGIDAASRELGCRPEVFGTAFRFLGEHRFSYGGYTEERKELPALGKTYHVGEDFPDIVNGLRAIDEVISFLDFDCGDRLGHALVLGVDVEEWYEQKHREISVSIQDRLDDLAWLYHALVHFSIPNVGALKERIKRDFEYWFRIVYRNAINEEHMRNLMQSAKHDCYDRTHEDHGRYNVHSCHFDIMDYYRAWMLRGDDPSCYINGYFKKPFGSSLIYSEEKAKICTNFPHSFEDRYISEYSILNYLYQFNDHVRRGGNRKIKVDVTGEYICAVKAVQIEMRNRIARKGIAIETNPTSNVLIGTFRKYDKHPILAFCNRGLPVSEEEEDACAQLQVSINTDDSGVFYTDLETEYALLARSVELITDENDRPRFKKCDIYTWLDNIRVMGNEQTFRKTD